MQTTRLQRHSQNALRFPYDIVKSGLTNWGNGERVRLIGHLRGGADRVLPVTQKLSPRSFRSI